MPSKEYLREWRKKNPDREKIYYQKIVDRNRKIIDNGKNKPCMDCGNTFPLCCMDYDHRDPSIKRKSIAKMLYSSLKRLLSEIEKCDVVCANCHRIRTHELRKSV